MKNGLSLVKNEVFVPVGRLGKDGPVAAVTQLTRGLIRLVRLGRGSKRMFRLCLLQGGRETYDSFRATHL